MIQVDSISDVKGKWIRENIQVLEEPKFDESLNKWTALAIVDQMLCLVELSVKPVEETK